MNMNDAEPEKAENQVANAMSNDLKKLVIHHDPKDWGGSAILVPGMISLSKLEAMLPGARKPSAEEEYVEKYINIRHNWKPSVQNNKTPIVDKETTF